MAEEDGCRSDLRAPVGPSRKSSKKRPHCCYLKIRIGKEGVCTSHKESRCFQNVLWTTSGHDEDSA